MKKAVKIIPLLSILVAVPSCRFFDKKTSSENYELEDGLCLIVDPLKESNSYRLDEFKEIFNNTQKNVGGVSITYSEFVNYMPTPVCDKYDVAAYRVTRVHPNEDTDFYDYYLMHNGKIYDVGIIGGRKDGTSGFIQFLFSDFNQDGYVEITTSYYTHNYSTLCYLSTLDTKTGYFLHTSSVVEQWLYFKYENSVYIYGKEFDGYNIGEKETLYSTVDHYSKTYGLTSDEIKLESEHYKVKITLDRGSTTFPLIYRGLKPKLYITTEMLWLGETFTYRNGTNYKAGAFPTFYQVVGSEEIPLKVEWWSEDMVVTDFTVYRYETITKKYIFYDDYLDMSPIGSYDLSVSYRDEVVDYPNALEVKVIS